MPSFFYSTNSGKEGFSSCSPRPFIRCNLSLSFIAGLCWFPGSILCDKDGEIQVKGLVWVDGKSSILG